jgi:hypothetical protein
LRLRISGGQRYPAGQLAVEADLEGILAGTGKGHVEHQYRTGLNVNHACGWLSELNRALSSEELTSTLIDEANPDGMYTDFGSAAPDPEHQMGPGVHRGKIGEPNVLKHAQHAQLALLIDQGIVGYNGKIEMQLS